MTRPLLSFSLAAVLFLWLPAPVVAQTSPAERLCDTQYEDCAAALIELIRKETVGIDVAFWFMNDGRYVNELIARHRAGVRVRILIDESANNSHPYNEPMLVGLRDGGLPMRDKYLGDILHFKMMLFHAQNVVQFSKANYSWEALAPIEPNVNYTDEVIYFTDDQRLTQSFKRRFDDLWVDTSQYRNYANVVGPLTRVCPTCTIDPSMNFVPTEDFSDRSVWRMDNETRGIDAIVFRATNHRQADAMIRAVARGVVARLITEPSEYRNPKRLVHAKHIDRMYMGGVQIKHRKHAGLMHQASIVLQNLGEVIFGSSNWTTASAGYQDEHNFFYAPSLNKPWFFQWFQNQFTSKWNDTTNYEAFQPLPPDSPVYAAPSNGVGAQSSSVTLTWDGGIWAHLFDIHFGTTPNPPLIESNLELGSPQPNQPETYTVNNLQPGTTYYWRVVGKTFALVGVSGPTWSFTTAGTPTGGTGGSPYGGTAAAVPGLFQAENFDEGGQGVAYFDTTAGNSKGAYRTTDVDIEPAADTGGGFNIAKTRQGEWLQYTVNVATAGTYTFEARVATMGSGAQFSVHVDGTDVTGPLQIPATGGWQTWQTISKPGITLSAGLHVVRVLLSLEGSAGGVGNFNWFRLVQGSTAPPPDPDPDPNPAYGGTPAALPGTFQAENFDEGGQGSGYFDTTSGNAKGAYRTTDVDIEPTADTGGGFNIAKTRQGEWLQYTVNVAAAGTYAFEARVATTGTGAKFVVHVDGTDVTGPVDIPSTGGWQTWQTISRPGITLSAGLHVVRVLLAVEGTSGGVGNFNWFRVVQNSTTPPPPPPPPPPPDPSPAYGGTPVALPGIVQTENFDEGAQGVAYNDATSWNSGAVYRNTAVDIDATADAASGGYYVGWTRAGEWLRYTVNVTQTRNYTLNVRVANLGSGATFRVEVDGVDRTGAIAVPSTGGWDRWQTVTVTGVPLTQGTRTIRLVMLTPNVENSGVGNFGYIQFQ